MQSGVNKPHNRKHFAFFARELIPGDEASLTLLPMARKHPDESTPITYRVRPPEV